MGDGPELGQQLYRVVSGNRRLIVLMAAIAVGLTGLLVVGGITAFRQAQRWRSADGLARPDQTPALPAWPADRDGPISVAAPSDDVAERTDGGTGLVIAVTDAPDGADAIRLGTGPDLGNEPWLPIPAPRSTITVEVEHTGYQMVFVQFRMAGGGVSELSVVGGDIDPTWAAATSSSRSPDAAHEPSSIGLLSPTELVVRVEAGRLQRGGVEAYDLDDPAAGDDVGWRDGRRVVRRDGEVVGFQVSERTDVIRRPDLLVGRPLDGQTVAAGTWTIRSDDDPTYRSATAVEVRVLSRPGGGGVDADGTTVREVTHDFVLALPAELQPGVAYEVRGPSPVAAATFTFEPMSTGSPAVRVNQVGYHPADPKVAVLSGWFDGMGDGLAVLGSEPGFVVVDADDGSQVLSGVGRSQGALDEMGQGDLTGSPVVEVDFSGLTEPGRYRVCVERVGCSHRFAVSTDVWADLAVTMARAMYFQRSGVELGPPYSPFVRPRPYHPGDGVTVTASGYSLLQARAETANTDFDALVAADTGMVLDQGWGGHFDAGDWDRRIYHLWYARSVARLLSAVDPSGTNPLVSDQLHLPESGNGVPDLLDEALWTVDLYRRMQLDDGAVRGGIEASGHPPRNAASWTDDLLTLAYEPDPFSSYLYAGVAAEVSVVLADHDAQRAADLLDSALRAFAWADSASTEGLVEADELVRRQRAVAAAALLTATGDRTWHDVFVAAADFADDGDPNLSCHSHERCDAAWLYLSADPALTDPAIRADLEARFVATADAIVAAADGTAYGWTTENPFVPLVWGLGAGGAPHTTALFLAHQLTGDDRYRQAAVRSASVSLGLNPQNRSFITGVGDEPVRNPLIVDVQHGGLPAWPGTPVYGPHRLNLLDDDSWVSDIILDPAGASPAADDLPYLWQWYDVDDAAMFTEFTVHQSHAEALTAFGWLALSTDWQS